MRVGILNEDMGNCILEYENGAQCSYTQNFFARFQAARRGARLYGYKGTIHFCWYENKIRIYKHQSPVVETIDFTGEMPHFGGDRELCLDFLLAMRDGKPSRSPIEAGILSALTCLWARESAETHRYCQVVMPPRSRMIRAHKRTAGVTAPQSCMTPGGIGPEALDQCQYTHSLQASAKACRQAGSPWKKWSEGQDVAGVVAGGLEALEHQSRAPSRACRSRSRRSGRSRR